MGSFVQSNRDNVAKYVQRSKDIRSQHKSDSERSKWESEQFKAVKESYRIMWESDRKKQERAAEQKRKGESFDRFLEIIKWGFFAIVGLFVLAAFAGK